MKKQNNKWDHILDKVWNELQARALLNLSSYFLCINWKLHVQINIAHLLVPFQSITTLL